LVRALEKTGKNVTVHLDGGDADADFYYMCHAKQLVVSSGGFSALIAKMVRYYGGTIVGRTFDESGKPKTKIHRPNGITNEKRWKDFQQSVKKAIKV
jgi:hypothetical protein